MTEPRERLFAESILSSLIPAAGSPIEVCGYLWEAIGILAREHSEVRDVMQRTILQYVERLKQ